MTLDRLHLDTFAKAVKGFMKGYGLTGWHIEVSLEPSEDAMAWVVVQGETHRVDFGLASEWDEEPTDERLRDKAQHEVLHVLLGRLSAAAADRNATEAELQSAEEEVVIRLMGLLPKVRSRGVKKSRPTRGN
jgi:hypothetical protein